MELNKKDRAVIKYALLMPSDFSSHARMKRNNDTNASVSAFMNIKVGYDNQVIFIFAFSAYFKIPAD